MVELEIVFLELEWCIGEYYLTMYLKNKIRNTVENSSNKTYKALFIEASVLNFHLNIAFPFIEFLPCMPNHSFSRKTSQLLCTVELADFVVVRQIDSLQ